MLPVRVSLNVFSLKIKVPSCGAIFDFAVEILNKYLRIDYIQIV